MEFWIMVSYLDLILLVPVGFALWRGWKNGFIMEIFSLLALFAGVYIAIYFSDWMTEIMRDKLEVRAEYLPVVSFVIVLIGVAIGLFFLGKVITKAVKAGGGETLNNLAGAVFSLMKYLIMLSLFFIFFNMADSRIGILPDEQKKKSYFYEPIYRFSLFVLPALRQSEFYRRLEEKQMAPLMVPSASPVEETGGSPN